MSDFNLVDEPFLLVENAAGSTRELSLRETFRQASDLRRLAGDLPTQEFAFLRLLLAIVYDSLQQEIDWERLWDEGLPRGVIDGYLDRWYDRFWLFDGERPFMQVAGLATARNEISGLEKLIADIPNGEALFSMRSRRGAERIRAAEAARWLVHGQAFDPSGIRSGAVGDPLVKGGRGYPIGPGWAGQLGGLVVHGSTLEQTLILNLVPQDVDRSGDVDRPVWRLDEPASAVRRDFTEADPPGTVSLLTWQSRRIRLVGDREGVTGVVLAQGDKMTPQNRQRYETLTGWRYSKPQSKKFGRPVYMPRKHDPTRSMWRALPSMLAEVGEVEGHRQYLPAATLCHIAEVEWESGEQLPVRLQTVGITYGSQEAVVEELVSDELDLSVALLMQGKRGDELRGLVDDAVLAAEQTARALGRLASNLAKAEGERGEDAGEAAAGDIRARFFAGIDHGARAWIGRLAGAPDIDAALAGWKAYLRTTARQFAREQLDLCSDQAVIGRQVAGPGGAAIFMTAALAERFFTHELQKVLPDTQSGDPERNEG
ncbi:CRISPR system Cascade subunit CasA [Raineyella antarctica]|uniref:CRISPR system Cascade subunit CasA n=1 Tax=Raineyella antarctica TaxID=1577474 RepID=A0A1G6H8D2_9ACTN|nr:type I-E CRISPR-associated protein Cse1/CasA [Raineyella antarctica]SDB89696.1 CRISPR system Cascade subunit CasA [Raineyella antarctica]